MRLILPADCAGKLRDALKAVGSQEIGGVVMGEHVGDEVFRVKEITVQRHGGAFASFIRFVQDIVQPLARFFQATGHNYLRYNYLGEWHSHPSFALSPSRTDVQTMREIVDDASVGANFAILLIVKLNDRGELQAAPFVFPAGRAHYPGTIEVEP